jgi:hypothetical protein
MTRLRGASSAVPSTMTLPLISNPSDFQRGDTDEESHVSISRLLLFYQFHRRSAKAIRIGFYAALGFMTSVITVVMNDAESRKDVGFNVWILASSGILALFLRFWAVSADSPGQR